MRQNHELDALKLVTEYRDACRSRGQEPQRALGLYYTGPAGEFKRDFVLSWGISDGYVEMIRDRQANPKHWEIREIP